MAALQLLAACSTVASRMGTSPKFGDTVAWEPKNVHGSLLFCVVGFARELEKGIRVLPLG